VPRWQRVLVTVLIIIIVLAGAALTWLSSRAEQAWAGLVEGREIHAKLAADALPLFLADVEAEAEAPIFVRGERDAGPFLNPRLPWQFGSPHIANSELIGTLTGLPVRLKGTELPPLAELSDEERDHISGLDLDWIGDLARYDTWDLLPESPLGRPSTPGQLPMLSAEIVLAFAELRLLQGEITGAPDRARREVEHLAKLALDSEDLPLAFVAVRVLALARAGDEVHLEQTRRARRLIAGAPAMLQLGVEARVRDRAVRAMKKVPWLECLARNAMSNELAIQVFAERHLPGAWGIARHERAPRCRMRDAKILARRRDEDPYALIAYDSWWRGLPLVRDAEIARALHNYKAGELRPYRRLKARRPTP
jgi:hypothetical protein